MKKTFLVVVVFPLLTVAMVFAPASSASTSLAWQPNVLGSIGQDEMQAILGPGSTVPFGNLSWSSRTTLTELGKQTMFSKPWINFALPPCNSQITLGCIGSVSYQVGKSGWVQAQLSTRQLPSRNGETVEGSRNASGVLSIAQYGEWKANLDNHEPAGGRASFWKFKNAPHGGGDEYLVRANISGIDSPLPTFNGKIQRYLELAVFPVSDTAEYQFPENIEIRVQLKLGSISQDLWGWFDGRVINPEVILDVESADGIVEVAGAPARTPIGVTPKKKLSEVGSEITSIFACPAGLPESMCPPRGGWKWMSTDGNSPLSYFALFEKGLGEAKTVGYKTEWSLETTRWPEVANVPGCSKNQNGFAGIVASNASMYETNAPRWNFEDQAFEFQVASPHMGIDGKPNLGYYTLILPIKLAECRWGTDVSKAKAVISVVASDGQRNIGISNYSVRGDLLKFFVGGFTYSSPIIKIQLKAPETIKTPVKAETTVTPNRLRTISCVKGKLVKKVTAVNPVCPKGFRSK